MNTSIVHKTRWYGLRVCALDKPLCSLASRPKAVGYSALAGSQTEVIGNAIYRLDLSLAQYEDVHHKAKPTCEHIDMVQALELFQTN